MVTCSMIIIQLYDDMHITYHIIKVRGYDDGWDGIGIWWRVPTSGGVHSEG
jgi:hypothetical protein